MQSRLLTAKSVFFSACHLAELTKESIAGEGLQLAGAVPYCGFRSVVGIMTDQSLLGSLQVDVLG